MTDDRHEQDALPAIFEGDSDRVLARMHYHFSWLAQDAARGHDPSTDWDGFVDRLWESTARWAGWADDRRSREDVPAAWFERSDDARVVAWYDDSDDRADVAGPER